MILNLLKNKNFTLQHQARRHLTTINNNNNNIYTNNKNIDNINDNINNNNNIHNKININSNNNFNNNYKINNKVDNFDDKNINNNDNINNKIDNNNDNDNNNNNILKLKRVVVTGMGLITPLGCGLEYNWKRLINGESGIQSYNIENSKIEIPSKVAALVPKGEGEGEFNQTKMVPSEVRLASSDFIKYAVAASNEAIQDSGIAQLLKDNKDFIQERTGVFIGSGTGSMEEIIAATEKISTKSNESGKISAYFIPRILINEASGIVSILHKAKGPNLSIVSACATGSHCIGESFRKIKYGEADLMICGGSEASINSVSLVGFSKMKALSTKFNDNPKESSRPFDKKRDGFVMGEGAGILVLEEYEHAISRGAKIYCEIKGYGSSGDAFHISAPNSDGNGPFRSMSLALKESGLNAHSIDYFNAHATSTPLGDGIECKAIKDFVNQNNQNNNSQEKQIVMSSNKGSIGHLLGAAGSVESIFSILSLYNNIIPPTLNLNEPSDDCLGINLVPNKSQQLQVNNVLKNSFGFGGTNCSLIFSKIK